MSLSGSEGAGGVGAARWKRRTFLTTVGLSAGAMALSPLFAAAGAEGTSPAGEKAKARVRAAFLYPPSSTFADDPDGWWSWPGTEFDAEGRQNKFAAELRAIEKKLAVQIEADEKPIADTAGAQRFIKELQDAPPDGVLLVMFQNRSVGHADAILKAAGEAGIPGVFYVELGVKHGSINNFRRPGVYFIQSLENFAAIEYGMRMIAAKKRMSQSKILRISENQSPDERVEPFLGVTTKGIEFERYAELFRNVKISDATKKWIGRYAKGAKENGGVTAEALECASRAHFALTQLLEAEKADGLTMNCLKRGMLKPCMSFSALNDSLIPAACENDINAAYGQMLGQALTARPGFQHNPAFDTERNHYFGSHCTCPTKLNGPAGAGQEFSLRRFFHSNEGSCAPQVFWTPDTPVTMIHYYSGKDAKLDVYAGKVVRSYSSPPVGGCITNVAIEITDRDDAGMVAGHHNLIYCGDFARQFRRFANLYKLPLVESGSRGA